jgi:hypothetical protein
VVRLTVGESTWAVPDSHRLIRPPACRVTQVRDKIRSAV